MKYGNSFYAEVSRSAWDTPISDNARYLFFWLNELEQRFTSGETDWFYRTNADLMSDLGWSDKKLKSAKRELLQTDLVETFPVHFVDEKTGKKSTRSVTGYRILK